MKSEPGEEAGPISLSPQVFKLALFGRPVSHSLSPLVHQDFARQHGLRIDYELQSCADSEFSAMLKAFFTGDARGANVTVPFKGQAAACVDRMSATAQASGVVNTISVDSHGRLLGHNTDGSGFVQDLQQRQHFPLQNATVLVIGAGGAAQGLIPSLLAEKPGRLIVANRSSGRLQALRTRFREIEMVTLDKLPDLPAFDLIINATSLGHQGLSPPIEKNLFGSGSLAYDLSYGKAARAFLADSSRLGASKVVDGLGMLVEQAAQAFTIWFDRPVSTQRIYQQLARRSDAVQTGPD